MAVALGKALRASQGHLVGEDIFGLLIQGVGPPVENGEIPLFRFLSLQVPNEELERRLDKFRTAPVLARMFVNILQYPTIQRD